jgi:serine/threonine protein kinase
MIRDQGIPGEDLVLIDFSIAIVQDADETLHGLSRAAGTLQYMAPEQAVGYADASSDIYSLAKILLEMLTGQRLSVLLPDASLDLPARIHDLLTQTPYGLSASSIDLIAQALEFDPSRRPKNVSDFTTRIAANWQTL